MVKVCPDGKDEYYMSDPLQINLDAVKDKVKKDWDMCFLIDGVEGSGKSTFGMQLAKYLDPTFDISKICFRAEDFLEKIKRHDFLKKGDCILLDEGFIINSRASMTQMNREFLGILSECRQKNLFLVIILPSFFDLDKNLALWRSRGLFHIYHESMERGYFNYYGYDKKKYLYVAGKKFYDYKKAAKDFNGRFTKYVPIDEEEYKRLKLHAFEYRTVPISSRVKKYFWQRNVLMNWVYEKKLLNQTEIGEILKMPQRSVSEICSGDFDLNELTEDDKEMLKLQF
jgi:ABC-type dipeptide/oligopeptide/nickel transport system ATPase subunit